MAFAGHARSLDLSYTSSGTAVIEHVHPDRHRHIFTDQLPPKRTSHGPSGRSKNYSAHSDLNNETYGHNQYDDTPSSNRLSFEKAMSLGTDDKCNSPTRTLWIGNVPPDLTDDDLLIAFAKYGSIVSVRATPADHCGFVNYESVESAIEAWLENHETDIFNTGVLNHVRYKIPPSWLKDKHQSVKRKRSSTNIQLPFPDDHLKRSAPTGPRSQVQHNIPPNGPRLRQASISPPPLRRHDTYRPQAPSEEDRPPRKVGERHRQNDLYRPSYDGDGETMRPDKRSSTQTRDDSLLRDRVCAQGSPASIIQSVNNGLVRSPSPSASSLHSSNRENVVSSLGIGIKGLAASRKESASEDRRSGLLIKGAATQNRIALPAISGTAVSQKVPPLRKSILNEKHVATEPVRRPHSPSPALAQAESESSKPARNETAHISTNGVLAVDLASLQNSSTTVKEATKFKNPPNSLRNLKDKVKQAHPFMLEKAGPSLPYLSYLFEMQEKIDVAAQKARTISPLEQVRALSRAAASVKSAKTEPIPSPKLLPPTMDKCDHCGVVGDLLVLSRCSVPTCFARVHKTCGRLTFIA